MASATLQRIVPFAASCGAGNRSRTPSGCLDSQRVNQHLSDLLPALATQDLKPGFGKSYYFKAHRLKRPCVAIKLVNLFVLGVYSFTSQKTPNGCWGQFSYVQLSIVWNGGT